MASIQRRPHLARAGLLVGLMLAYVPLALYFDLVLQSTVYVHLGYVPIVLAALWWGWWGLGVAGLQAALLLGLRLGGVGIGPPWSDALRIAFLLIVSACVALLSERLRRAHAAAEVSRENYRVLFEKSLAGVCVYRDERLVLANRRLAEMLGRSAESMVGLSIWEFIHPDEHRAVRERLARRSRGEAPDLHYECWMVRADGSRFWADMASSLTHYDGREAVLVNLYDITERKEAVDKRFELSELARQQEEQLVHSSRLAELGEMAAAVAHELNQPLTGIRTFAKNAAYMIENDAGEPGEVRETLQRISEQVERAARIIGQMRQLTRRTERQRAPVDLNAVLGECVDFLRHHLQLSGVAVELVPDPRLPELLGDRLRLEQVFLNLITNARQAMEEAPERRLRIETRFEEGRPCPVVAVVRDTGPGFEPAAAARLFAPFFTTKQPGHGTGLGLSISLNIVKDHGGTIEAAGVPGQGATFTVRLPLESTETPGGAGAPKDGDRK